MCRPSALRLLVLGFFLSRLFADAAPLTVTVAAPEARQAEGFHMGTAKNPRGDTLTFDNQSLLLNGKPWTPVMGEFHYTRYPAAEWREELLKMKAGGISILATYVFWIHHEEIENEWDWSERRNLREFVRIAGDVGLKVIVRCGPWCHGEVRNGGLPEWLLTKGGKLRTEDPLFMGRVGLLYGQIAQQLDGLLWKNGGPVVGIQLDNEYGGPAEYLLALKRLAQQSGLDVPIYTRTGWPALTTPMPFGEIVPLYGAYAEGFWDRELTVMPDKKYWSAFRFSKLRIDDNIASEQLGHRDVKDAADVALYPYLTCELGGGMMNSYHRRILIQPGDVESTMLVKLGSGSTLPGYYMYHGGTNPEGKRTTLMEAQNTATTNWNDLPVKNYDFQGPLGEFGQIRPQYHLLRRVHLFLQDFGAGLATMPAAMPDVRPEKAEDAETLRWAVRSDGSGGFVFVNNYERLRPMPEKCAVQFSIATPGRTWIFPEAGVTIPAESRLIWPFNFDLGHGVRLDYATAQPVCTVEAASNETTYFFAETTGVPAQFAVAGEAQPRRIKPSRKVAFQLKGSDGYGVKVVLLSEADSLALWKMNWQGRDRVFLTDAGLSIDGAAARLTSLRAADLSLGVYPALERTTARSRESGIFTVYTPKTPPVAKPTAKYSLVRQAGPAREIPLGQASEPVAASPSDQDFAQAAVWRIELPANLDYSTDPILRIRYAGDVARIQLNGRFLTDDFYNGNVWEIGLRRYADELGRGRDLQISILPLRQDAVMPGKNQRIFLPESARPKFGAAGSVAELQRIEIVPRYQAEIQATAPK